MSNFIPPLDTFMPTVHKRNGNEGDPLDVIRGPTNQEADDNTN